MCVWKLTKLFDPNSLTTIGWLTNTRISNFVMGRMLLSYMKVHEQAGQRFSNKQCQSSRQDWVRSYESNRYNKRRMNFVIGNCEFSWKPGTKVESSILLRVHTYLRLERNSAALLCKSTHSWSHILNGAQTSLQRCADLPLSSYSSLRNEIFELKTFFG